MFLSRLEIDNIRSIEHLELSFDDADGARQWTLLLGENGTGKSTVLRSIALALGGSDALAELLGSPSDWIRRPRKAGRVRVDMTTADGEPRAAELVFRRDEAALKMFERNRESLAQLDAAIERSARNYFTVGYGVSRRPGINDERGPRASSSRFRTARARSVGTLFSSDSGLVPLESWVMDLDYRRGPKGLQAARRALTSVLPGIELIRVDREGRQLMFRTPDGTVPYRLLSDGYQNVASWIGDLLYHVTDVFDDYRKPLTARGVLLIDEVDLHLHPVWQRELQRFLTTTFPNLQIVATTHSPLTAHQTKEGELYFLRRLGKEPAYLDPYEGAANLLLLHQLIASPQFGFETLDSEPVEDLKREYRLLRDQTSRSKEDAARLKVLSNEISQLPVWEASSPAQESAVKALRRIERMLEE